MKILSCLMISSLFLGACTSKEAKRPVSYSGQSPKITTTKPKRTDITAQMLASEAGTNLVTEVDFRQGSSQVTPAAQKKLNSLYQKASKQKIEEVQLVTWGDQEYPDKQKKLSKSEQDLVKNRNEQLESAIKKFDGDLKIQKVSMATETDGLKELTDPTSAEVKESMEDVDIATNRSPSSGERKASKSIVIFVPEK